MNQNTEAAAAFNQALRCNLTMINKGFVQCLNLRFLDSKDRAQLAYGDNLAETRRLMTLLREMQHLGIHPSPDAGNHGQEAGVPDLQSEANLIWRTDLALASARLDALKCGRMAILSGLQEGLSLSGIEALIEEGADLVAELQDRAEGKENLGQFDPEQVQSDAEKNSLDDFFDYADGTEDALLQNRMEDTRPEGNPVFPILNTVLGNCFLAIDQFFLHGFLGQKWGDGALADGGVRHSVDAMKSAYWIAQRILIIGGVPRSDFLDDIRLPYRVRTGSTPQEAIRYDLDLTENLIDSFKRAQDILETAEETRSVELLSRIIDAEHSTQQWLVQQSENHASGAGTGNTTGNFGAMLDRWAVD